MKGRILAGWAQESPKHCNELFRNFETKPYQQNQQELQLHKHLPFKQHHETTINKQGNPKLMKVSEKNSKVCGLLGHPAIFDGCVWRTKNKHHETTCFEYTP